MQRLFVRRTLRRYVAKRFLFSIVGAFVVCACLIFMIDMIELLRMSRRATDLSVGTLLWIGLLRLPAFTEILLAFAVLGWEHRRAAEPQPEVRAHDHAVGGHVGMAVPCAPG